MPGPRITIDLERIEHNARSVVAACATAGIEVFGVTKGTCGMPQVARAMLRGGVTGIGESRFENIRRLRASGLDCPILLLRSPPLARVEETIATVDISLNSELTIIRELSRVAERMARVHDIILMVDLGDLREGIWPDDLEETVAEVLKLPGVRIAGLGTNLTCFGAILPSEENLSALLAHARALEQRFGLKLGLISGGNSSSLPLLLAGKMPQGITQLRIGEAILQGGRDTFLDLPWEALDRDAFRLSGELLEVKVKPSLPIGTMGLDAFGRKPVFEDRGDRLRGILNLGREDVVVEGLVPIEAGVEVLGASSDHLVVDLTELQPPPRVGERLSFRMSYGALLMAMTSEYVEKEPLLDKALRRKARRVTLLAEPDLAGFVQDCRLERRLRALEFETRKVKLPAAEEMSPAPTRELSGAPALVAEAVSNDGLALLLGSDHRITLAGLRALASRVDAFGLLWFDATPSFRPPGEAGARPADSVLAQALGHDPKVAGVMPQLSPENVVMIGLRDVTPTEAEMIRASPATVFTIADIDALGIREVMRQALQIANAGTRGLYVSYCPAVSDIPNVPDGSGGITLRETHQAMEIVAQTHALLAMDVVGLNPDSDERLQAQAANFIMSCFGKQIL